MCSSTNVIFEVVSEVVGWRREKGGGFASKFVNVREEEKRASVTTEKSRRVLWGEEWGDKTSMMDGKNETWLAAWDKERTQELAGSFYLLRHTMTSLSHPKRKLSSIYLPTLKPNTLSTNP